MPRDGTNTYNLPFPDVVAGTTIASPVYNGFTHDIAQDLNLPRPISAGGTGATSADGALAAMGAEKSSQAVTNYDSQVWIPGSFYSAAGATSAPNAHAFSGIIYQADSSNIVVEARDSSDGKLYIRRKVAGSWGAWALDGDLSGVNAAIALKVAIAGDTMTGPLVLPAAAPTLGAHATNKTYVDAADVANASAASAANTNANNRVLKAGDTMTGFLVLHADPDAAMKAATKQYADTKLAIAGGQTLTGGFALTPNNLGNIAASFTPNPLLGNYQYGTNNGAATWNAPTVDCAMDILVTNSASAGVITFSGYTALSTNVGDVLNTVNTNKFIVSLRRINAVATYTVKALQ